MWEGDKREIVGRDKKYMMGEDDSGTVWDRVKAKGTYVLFLLLEGPKYKC